MAPQLPSRRGRHNRRRSLAARLVVVLAAVAALIATTSGVALAYFTSSGSGTGQASTGSIGTITVTATIGGDAVGTTLIPGQSGDVVLRVNNPNAYSVHVSAIAGNGSITASPSCTPTGVTFTAPSDFSAAQFTLASGSNYIRLINAATMDLTSSSACQGATFSIPVAVTVQK